MAGNVAAAEKLHAAERGVAAIRLAGIALLTAFHALRPQSAPGLELVAIGALAAGWCYSLWVIVAQPYKRYPLLATSFVTFAGDTIFVSLWVWATGGFASPYYVIWYVAVTSVAFRYDVRETTAAATLYSASYALLLILLGQAWGHWIDIGIRTSFIFLVGAAGMLLSREAYAQARAKVEMRERAQSAEASEARLRQVLEASPDAILVTDPTGCVRIANRRAGALFRSDALLGAPLGALLKGDEREAVVHGTPVEITSARVQQGSETLTIHALRDLSERRKAEQARADAQARLAEIERLRDVDAFKTRFLNTAAHELGTPLTPIKVQVKLLKGDASLAERSRRSVDILDRNVERLQALVSDLIEGARLQAGELGLQREPTDLNHLALEALESFQDAARAAGVHLEARTTPGLVAEVDPRRVTQVLFHLVGNAIKFTPPGGRVTVETSAAEDMVLVRVRDTGIGIAADKLPQLFQPFHQAHDHMERTRAGTGLGLYISRGIVALHGGSITAESPGVDKGSTFTVRLPVRAPAARRFEVSERRSVDAGRR